VNGAGQPDDPLRVLRDQERETSTDFVAKVRRRIERRTAASQVAAYSWHLPKVVLVEMSGLIRHLIVAVGGKGDAQR
jgi:hypothetical protein